MPMLRPFSPLVIGRFSLQCPGVSLPTPGLLFIRALMDYYTKLIEVNAMLDDLPQAEGLVGPIMTEINAEAREMIKLILQNGGWGEIKVRLKGGRLDELALNLTRKPRKKAP
jgi:hypothetical protein